MIKAMIFDLDGTLLDSMNVWRKIDIDFLGKRGFDVPADYLEAITPMGFLNAAKYTKERFGFAESVEEIEEEWLRMAEYAYTYEVELKPGAKEFLQMCHEKGIQLAAATSSLERLFLPALKHHEIDGLFATAVTTKQVGEDKRSPKIYQMAAERLGVAPEECVVFEDIVLGVKTARDAGFYTVGVFDACSNRDIPAMEAASHKYIREYRELVDMGVDALCQYLKEA